jgi:hypothetical protein
MLSRTLDRIQTDGVRTARLLAVVWVLLSLADAAITYVCLQDTANIEGNPLARTLLSQGDAIFYGAKILVTTGIGLGFWWLAAKTMHLRAMISCQLLLVVMFAAVLGNNALHL